MVSPTHLPTRARWPIKWNGTVYTACQATPTAGAVAENPSSTDLQTASGCTIASDGNSTSLTNPKIPPVSGPVNTIVMYCMRFAVLLCQKWPHPREYLTDIKFVLCYLEMSCWGVKTGVSQCWADIPKLIEQWPYDAQKHWSNIIKK